MKYNININKKYIVKKIKKIFFLNVKSIYTLNIVAMTDMIISNIGYLGAGLGVSFIIIGAALGIGLIGKAAMTAISKQPDVSGDIRTTMIIISALIEGITLFALIVCMLLATNSNPNADKLKLFSAGLGSGLVVFGSSLGIGLIGKSALDGIARQPEARSTTRTSMIIVSALIEGVALFAVIICMLLSM